MITVEWLMEEMQKMYIFNQDGFDMFKQAKEMERDNLIMFGSKCMVEVEKDSGLGSIRIYELVFNKTFKSE